jgi:arginine deiminase
MTGPPAVGVTTEVGRLRTVLLHRPGDELKRLTPRNNDELLFDGIPWVERAQAEHDAFAATLRTRGVEVLILRELLEDTLEIPAAREELIDSSVSPHRVGPALAGILHRHLQSLSSTDLAEVLTAGLSVQELPSTSGVVARMAAASPAREFVVAPLPNLMFTRDSSVWVGPRVAVTRPSTSAREREVSLTGAIYRHHPRFAGTPILYAGDAPVPMATFEGGDVLLLSPGVVAVGVGQRTTPAGVESFAAEVFAAGCAHTVLAVPIAQERATMHLDTICTMVDVDAVVMYPPMAETLTAFVVTPGDPGDPLQVSGPDPFLVAAAKAMGIDTLRMIDTGLDPVTAEREQWDDGNNTLAIGPRLAVAYERNVETNARLEDAGIEVVRIAGSELGSGRGGPRCMSCPILRDRLPS